MYARTEVYNELISDSPTGHTPLPSTTPTSLTRTQTRAAAVKIINYSFPENAYLEKHLPDLQKTVDALESEKTIAAAEAYAQELRCTWVYFFTEYDEVHGDYRDCLQALIKLTQQGNGLLRMISFNSRLTSQEGIRLTHLLQNCSDFWRYLRILAQKGTDAVLHEVHQNTQILAAA
jgi:hypothetical protein